MQITTSTSSVVTSLINNPLTIIILVLSGFVVVFLVVFVFRKIKHILDETRELETAQKEIGIAYQRLDAIFRVNQSFIEAADENEIVDQVLDILLNLDNIEGVSFVAVDEHGFPRSAFSRGQLQQAENEAWLERLASLEIREICKECDNYDRLQRREACPLFDNPIGVQTKLLCVPVQRGEKNFGIF